jgi:hypothetical protein
MPVFRRKLLPQGSKLEYVPTNRRYRSTRPHDVTSLKTPNNNLKSTLRELQGRAPQYSGSKRKLGRRTGNGNRYGLVHSEVERLSKR